MSPGSRRLTPGSGGGVVSGLREVIFTLREVFSRLREVDSGFGKVVSGIREVVSRLREVDSGLREVVLDGVREVSTDSGRLTPGSRRLSPDC